MEFKTHHDEDLPASRTRRATRLALGVAAALVASAAAVARATPVDDFMRGTSVEVTRASALLDLPGPDEQVSSSATQCLSKTPWTLDVTLPLDGFGLPGVSVPFTGNALDHRTIAFTTAPRQPIRRCLKARGLDLYIDYVQLNGALTATLGSIPTPSPASAPVCAASHPYMLEIAESSTGELEIGYNYGCVPGSGSTIYAKHIAFTALAGELPPPPPPPEVQQVRLTPQAVCDVPAIDIEVRGEVVLTRAAAEDLWVLLESSDMSLVPYDARTGAEHSLSVPAGARSAEFRVRIPAGHRGSYRIEAQVGDGARRRADSAVGENVPFCSGISRYRVPNNPRSWIVPPCLACAPWRLSVDLRSSITYVSRRDPHEITFESRPTRTNAVAGWRGGHGGVVGFVIGAIPGAEIYEQEGAVFYDIAEPAPDGSPWPSTAEFIAGAMVLPDGTTLPYVLNEWMWHHGDLEYLKQIFEEHGLDPFSTPGRVLPGMYGAIAPGEALAVSRTGALAGWVDDGSGARMPMRWRLLDSGEHEALPIWLDGGASGAAAVVTEDDFVGGTGRDMGGSQFVFVSAPSGEVVEYHPPPGFTDLELVDLNLGGMGVAHAIEGGVRVPMWFYQGMLRPLSELIEGEIEVGRVFGIGPAGELLVEADDGDGPFVTILEMINAEAG
ncbi:hypothetical protein BE08_26655 [Sorangium cellulosum]|uniref:Uncharacterized protein n=1 Tax=Sorangium cellulosum TaxID=56 RepID=A0A150P0Q0_SORCE|nr:hypothetical protein BE08_26655 [Sorangium cellulosum]